MSAVIQLSVCSSCQSLFCSDFSLLWQVKQLVYQTFAVCLELTLFCLPGGNVPPAAAGPSTTPAAGSNQHRQAAHAAGHGADQDHVRGHHAEHHPARQQAGQYGLDAYRPRLLPLPGCH